MRSSQRTNHNQIALVKNQITILKKDINCSYMLKDKCLLLRICEMRETNFKSMGCCLFTMPCLCLCCTMERERRKKEEARLKKEDMKQRKAEW